jgi:hypothetical protein
MLKKSLFLFFFLASALSAVEYRSLVSSLQSNPFDYPLGIVTFEGKSENEPAMVCCHGYGGDEHVAAVLHAYGLIPDHLVGFRFPDYGKLAFSRPPETTCYGTIQEILPLLYILKQIAVFAQARQIDLYGFSAGGGAIVNALAVLVQYRYPQELLKIGINEKESKKILDAIEKGLIILDAPLKSMEEIVEARGALPPLVIIQKRYAKNHLRPIDSLEDLSPLKLNVLLYFEEPDSILSNRDDALFIERLRRANAKGFTEVVTGSSGGHNSLHAPLWEAYEAFKKKSM